MGILDFFGSKERASENVPENIQLDILRLWNDIGVVEQLHHTQWMTEEDISNWEKDIKERLGRLNKKLSTGAVKADQLQEWIDGFHTKNKDHPSRGYIDLQHRFWLSIENGHAVVEVNHLYTMYPELQKLTMLREIDKNKGAGFLKFMDEKIESIRPKPQKGELEKWLRSTGLSDYYTIDSGRIVEVEK
ncbi:MAG: hypothetical protein WCX61_00170 [Candidatus Peribacteraceae bacterium]|jgi:hypothetical protein